jgi:hypothetical protein
MLRQPGWSGRRADVGSTRHASDRARKPGRGAFLEEQDMNQVLPFGEVLEAADHRSQDEQEELIAILHRRLAQAARQRLTAEIQEPRQEFAEGRCLPASPDELMREIMK